MGPVAQRVAHLVDGGVQTIVKRGQLDRFGIEALDREGRRLLGRPVEVVLADRRHDRPVGNLVASVAEHELEVATGTDPELAGRDRRQRAPRLVVHEPGSQGEDELLAAVHPTAHYITLCRVDAGVAIDVVGVGSTPLAHKVVVAVKGRPARVAMEHGP